MYRRRWCRTVPVRSGYLPYQRSVITSQVSVPKFFPVIMTPSFLHARHRHGLHCFPRHALPRRHSVCYRSAPAGHHPRLARAMLCHHDGGTLWIILAAGAQQVRILRVLMPHEGFFMFYIITITLRCALAQPPHLPLLPAPMTPALHCSPRLLHTILTACDCLILSTTQAARQW